MIRRPPRSTLCPYTTLSQSTRLRWMKAEHGAVYEAIEAGDQDGARRAMRRHIENAHRRVFEGPDGMAQAARSEEHTSELQSRQYLVCRLLLENKYRRRPSPR